MCEAATAVVRSSWLRCQLGNSPQAPLHLLGACLSGTSHLATPAAATNHYRAMGNSVSPPSN